MIDPNELVIGILSDALAVPVTTEMPTDRNPRCVVVAQDGDESDEFVLRPRMNLMCWGDNDPDARMIAVACIDVLREASLDHPYLSSADLETLSRDLWTKTGQSRYLAAVELTINYD